MLRIAGVDEEHARALAETHAELPPIMVHRGTMRVVDGMHRLRAAQLRGHEEIQVRFFDGDDEDAFLAAVQANIRHGLPLTLADRTAAAARVVRCHADWSDRKIAGLVGLSPKTVGAVRVRLSEEIPQSAVRVGRDGRVRRLPVRARELPQPRIPEPRPAPVDPTTTYKVLCQDPSFRQTETGRFLLRLLDLHLVRVREWDQLVANVPPHQAGSVADLARECARTWGDFAEKVAREMDRHDVS